MRFPAMGASLETKASGFRAMHWRCPPAGIRRSICIHRRAARCAMTRRWPAFFPTAVASAYGSLEPRMRSLRCRVRSRAALRRDAKRRARRLRSSRATRCVTRVSIGDQRNTRHSLRAAGLRRTTMGGSAPRCDHVGHRAGGSRELCRRRALEALHDHRHGRRSRQDQQSQRTGRAVGTDGTRHRDAGHDNVPAAVHAGDFRCDRRRCQRRSLRAAASHAGASLACHARRTARRLRRMAASSVLLARH